MILVDSSVWIDFFRGNPTPAVLTLKDLLPTRHVATGDLILTEVLQGCNLDRDFEAVRDYLTALDVLEIGGVKVAVEAAQNFRHLRAKGITIRKTIDTLIATRCIMDGHALLFSDRDFDPFVEHLGLVSAMG
jgi:predicted nucleic acid-binding protein